MHYSRISFRDFLFSRDLWPCGCMRWPPAYPLAFPRHQLTVQPTSKSLAIIAISSHLLVNTLRASVQRAGFSSLTLQPQVKPKTWRNVGSLWHLIIVEMVLRHIPTWYYLGVCMSYFQLLWVGLSWFELQWHHRLLQDCKKKNAKNPDTQQLTEESIIVVTTLIISIMPEMITSLVVTASSKRRSDRR